MNFIIKHEYLASAIPDRMEYNRLLQQTSIASRIIQDQASASKTKCFQKIKDSGNRLPGSVIDYQKTILKN